MKATTGAAALVLSAALAVSACGVSEDTPTEPGTPIVPSQESEPASAGAAPAPRVDVIPGRSVSKAGFISLPTYESDKATYHSGDVVLFFNASWCSTCARPLANLSENPEDIPEGLTVVSVDFDAEIDLKKQYGVTTQHTFVQVDQDGVEVARWSGSRDIADIASKVQ